DYNALQQKGYNAVNQLVGYLISGDPSYITSYNGARALLRKLERDVFLEEVIKSYLEIK
ncbi:IreB family regulatory phosphoprotein, partial [Clostridium sp. HCS.1]|uniref:IreB family regulatory phosphoprotein n=1 Tax=Clostridium sp. HCS.1 TaxID=3238594 RepID=UPI003A0FF2B9